jgi:hypothetical protein
MLANRIQDDFTAGLLTPRKESARRSHVRFKTWPVGYVIVNEIYFRLLQRLRPTFRACRLVCTWLLLQPTSTIANKLRYNSQSTHINGGFTCKRVSWVGSLRYVDNGRDVVNPRGVLWYVWWTLRGRCSCWAQCDFVGLSLITQP